MKKILNYETETKTDTFFFENEEKTKPVKIKE